MANPRSGRKWADFTERFWRQYNQRTPYCVLCGHIVDVTLRGRTPWSRSVEHIIPLDQGGAVFDMNNCAPAHRVCNTARQTRSLTEFDTLAKKQAFRKVAEALASVNAARAGHAATLDRAEPTAHRVWAPAGWYPDQRLVGDRWVFTCCRRPIEDQGELWFDQCHACN